MRLRIKNPTPTQWAIIGGTVLVATIGISATAYAANKRKKRLPPIVVEPPVEPPIEPPVEPPVEPAEPGDWNIVTPTDPGYPWEFPALHYENYPTPGTWFNANDKGGAFDPANGFDLFVRALLGSALAMAGNDYQIAMAQGQDPNADLGRKLRRQVRESIIAVGGVNDLLYGQTNLNLAGGNDPDKPGGDPAKPMAAAYVLNEQGRGLDWLPRHADNIDRLQAAEPFKRTTALDGKKLPPPNSGNRQMLIWAPAYDLAALGPDKAVPTIRFLQWSDGTSTIDPPPQIQALGVDLSGVDLPGV